MISELEVETLSLLGYILEDQLATKRLNEKTWKIQLNRGRLESKLSEGLDHPRHILIPGLQD